MNIDELLKLPNTEEPLLTGGGKDPVALTIVGREQAKKLPTYQRIVLVDRTVEPHLQKIANLQALEKTGMKPENVLAINGISTYEIMKYPALQTNLAKYLFLVPMGFNYSDMSQVIQAQLLFIIVFQQLYFMALLADIKDIPALSQPFEKRYKKIKELISKEQITTKIFDVPTSQIEDGFWKTLKDLFGSNFEFSMYDVINWIIEKEPKELDAYFNQFVASAPAPGAPSSGGPGPLGPGPRGPGPLGPGPLGPGRPGPGPGPGGPGPGGPGPGGPGRSEPETSDPSDLSNNNNTSSVNVSIGNNENNEIPEVAKPVIPLIANAVYRILYNNENLYEGFVVKNKTPLTPIYQALYKDLMHYKKTQPASYEAGVKKYIETKHNHRLRGGGNKTMKNRKKINYVYE